MTTSTTHIHYTLRLTSDAEPGTGLGTEAIDDLVPRGPDGWPTLPASHIKGLLRDALGGIAAIRQWPSQIEDRLFGVAGTAGEDGEAGLASFGEARLRPRDGQAAPVSLIARTAISDHGTVRAGSLRVSERVHTGSQFEGEILLHAEPASVESQALLLALLAMPAIGGNRSRGAGRCVVDIKGCAKKPSELLREIDRRVAGGSLPSRQRQTSAARALKETSVFLELTFEATEPICCPTTPLTGTNVVRSGFAVPASAVQGALLHRIDAVDPAAASACFAHPRFRAWPLLPCAVRGEDATDLAPVWTSLTHRISKLAGMAAGDPDFRDSLIQPYDWRTVASGAPLKAADGVLLSNGASVKLWRASDMPRHVAAHVGLGADVPELYTVEAMAPMIFRGWIAVPEEVAGILEASLRADPHVTFGRSKTVRGGGRLSVTRRDPLSAVLGAKEDAQVFVVQSPIEVPSGWHDGPADAALRLAVEQAGWGEVEQAQANIELRFGWNRHQIGTRVEATNRLRAVPVIAPGSIVRMKAPLRELPTRLQQGVGGGRERGFGSVLPHPGIAKHLYLPLPALGEVKSRDPAGKWALRLVKAAEGSGLSASQISRLAQLATEGEARVGAYLERQRRDRPAAIWDRWKGPITAIRELLADGSIDAAVKARALRAWQDAAVAANSKEMVS